MANRSGIVIGAAGCVIWDVGRASCVLGMTLVCRALIKMMAATRMINIVTTKPMTTGRMDTSPTRRWGVGSLGEGSWSFLGRGFWSFMDGWMLKRQSGVRWAGVIR